MPLTRREFVVTSLAAGFATAVRPVDGQTIVTTDTDGLVAGEVKIPAAGDELPGYRAMPASGTSFPVVLVVQETARRRYGKMSDGRTANPASNAERAGSSPVTVSSAARRSQASRVITVIERRRASTSQYSRTPLPS